MYFSAQSLAVIPPGLLVQRLACAIVASVDPILLSESYLPNLTDCYEAASSHSFNSNRPMGCVCHDSVVLFLVGGFLSGPISILT